tara:strand:- start:189 stop:1265 length:1077 start_codon:yes stop_codon:yes gene_type:complete
MFTAPAKKAASKGLRDQLGEINAQKAALEAQLAERDATILEASQDRAELAERHATAQRSLSDRTSVGPYNEKSDPAVQALTDEMLTEMKEAAMFLPTQDAAHLSVNMETVLSRYSRAISEGKADVFKELIAEEFSEEAQLPIMRHVRDLAKIADRRAVLIQENRQNHFKSTIGNWQTKQDQVRASVASIGTMDAEAALAAALSDNGTADAVISVIANSNPGFKAELENIKNRATITMAGIRPFDVRDDRWGPYLDPLNPGQLSQEGTRLRESEMFNHQKGVEQMAPRLAGGMAAELALPIMARRLAELEARLGNDIGGEIEPNLDDAGNPLPVSKGTYTDEMMDDPSSIPLDHFGGLA